jgi:hypothetical protein
MLTLQTSFKTLLFKGVEGEKNTLVEVTVNSKKENSLRLLSQLRSRIRPLDTLPVDSCSSLLGRVYLDVLENDLPGEGVEEADLHARGPHIYAQHVGAVLHKHMMISK